MSRKFAWGRSFVAEWQNLIRVLAESERTCPGIHSNLNNYAWALATLPVDSLRNGQEARSDRPKT